MVGFRAGCCGVLPGEDLPPEPRVFGLAPRLTGSSSPPAVGPGRPATTEAYAAAVVERGTRLMKWASFLALAAVLLCACGGSGSSTTTYSWTATPGQTSAVGAAREMDAQLADVWSTYSDGLLLYYLYDFCEGLLAAEDVEQYLDERAASQGETVLLPLVVGSPYLCAERSDAVGAWINQHAANG